MTERANFHEIQASAFIIKSITWQRILKNRSFRTAALKGTLVSLMFVCLLFNSGVPRSNASYCRIRHSSCFNSRFVLANLHRSTDLGRYTTKDVGHDLNTEPYTTRSADWSLYKIYLSITITTALLRSFAECKCRNRTTLGVLRWGWFEAAGWLKYVTAPPDWD